MDHYTRADVTQPQNLDPSRSVFINCPFDLDFSTRFDAIIYTIVCCRLIPRSALETGSVAEPRYERIIESLFTAQYSIHDLSQCRGEGDEQLARFNMPLELGMAMARRSMQQRLRQANVHDWFVLVPEQHHYRNFISDLGGFDPIYYDGTAEMLILKVTPRLAILPNAALPHDQPLLTPQQVLASFPRFCTEMEHHRQQWGPDVPWRLTVAAARRTAS